MVKDGTDFAVYDAKSGDDITRNVLTQIIVEEESKGGQNLLPISFLRQLIGFYGDSLQGLVPKYLEHSMTNFATNQEKMRSYMQDAMQGMFPFGNIEEMNKQNMALFEQTMRMFNPTYQGDGENPTGDPQSPAAPQQSAPQGPSVQELQNQIELMQRQLASLASQVPTKKD
jgi:polyhydroxyalkanoate synthesis repressor PhaR